jgi:membrane dipeptidase
MCAVFYNAFLDDDWARAKSKIDDEIAPLLADLAAKTDGSPLQKYLATEPVRMKIFAARIAPLTVGRVVDHIDHFVNLAGVECVGLGSDFDGIPAAPQDLSSVADLPNLTGELTRRGYSANDIEKILGGNVLRVLETVTGA